MHEMLTYLNQQGVLSLLVLAQHGMIGAMGANVDLTYLSDTICCSAPSRPTGGCGARSRS